MDFVGDQYPSDSIKSLERQKRTQASSQVVCVTGAEQKLPSWKGFMSVSENKISLSDFLVLFWKTPEVAQFFKQRALYVTARAQCQRLSSPDGKSVVSVAVPALDSCQEEADTRMFLHAAHAATEGATAVLIKSLDTDVAVIGLWVAPQLACNLLLQTGTGQHTRLVSLTQVSRSFGPDICTALPGFHSFTGCDSVSSFGRRGKKLAYKLLTSGHSDAMQLLGNSLTVTDELQASCQQFVCKLYTKTTVAFVNDIRYSLFRQASRTLYEDLPPTQDALRQHTLWSNFQAHLWKKCLQAGPVPHPRGHGWCLDGKQLSIV